MFRGRFLFRFLAGVLILLLLAFGGYALVQTGISQGYALGLQAAGAETAPALPPVGFYPAYGFAPFWGFGLARFLIGLFIFFILLRLLFLPWMFRWGRWGGHGRGKWGHRHWGPPPWTDEQEAQDDQGQEGQVPGEA
jgi:hypothetical protein